MSAKYTDAENKLCKRTDSRYIGHHNSSQTVRIGELHARKMESGVRLIEVTKEKTWLIRRALRDLDISRLVLLGVIVSVHSSVGKEVMNA